MTDYIEMVRQAIRRDLNQVLPDKSYAVTTSERYALRCCFYATNGCIVMSHATGETQQIWFERLRQALADGRWESISDVSLLPGGIVALDIREEIWQSILQDTAQFKYPGDPPLEEEGYPLCEVSYLLRRLSALLRYEIAGQDNGEYRPLLYLLMQGWANHLTGRWTDDAIVRWSQAVCEKFEQYYFAGRIGREVCLSLRGVIRNGLFT